MMGNSPELLTSWIITFQTQALHAEATDRMEWNEKGIQRY